MNVANGDQPEILAADYSNSQLLVYTGNRLGFFRPARAYPTCANPNDLALADMNQDGNVDAVVTCVGASSVDVLLGNGKGGFTATPYNVELDPRAVAIADFDEDGQEDLAVVNGGSDTLNLLLAKAGVIAADTAPVAIKGNASIADGKNPLDGQMLASDKDSDVLSFGVVVIAEHGSVVYSTSSGGFEYQAGFNSDGTGYKGTDSFQFQVSDGVKLSNNATVHIQVAANSAVLPGSGSGSGSGGFGLPVLAALLPFLKRRRAKQS
jgi:VCBS repeat-containing protein